MRNVEFSQLRKRPYATRHIDLVPLVYLRQPDDWESEVVGCLRGLACPCSHLLPVQRISGQESPCPRETGGKRCKQVPCPGRPMS